MLIQIQKKQKKIKRKIKFNLNEITKGNPKSKSKEQLTTTENIKNLHNSRYKFIRLYNDYAKIISDS